MGYSVGLEVLKVSASSLPNSSSAVEKLAAALDIPRSIVRAQRGRLPDGSKFYPPRFRWCLLVKAVVERFCRTFAPGSVVLYIADSENRSVHLEIAALTALGVTLGSTAKIPDVIVHHTAKNWLLLIEAVTSVGAVDGKRRKELNDLFAGCKASLAFVTAFETRRTMQPFVSHIAWDSAVWIAEDPDHMIHFNGERLLGPYPDATPTSS